MAAVDVLSEGDSVVLRRRAGDALLLKLQRGPQSLEGLGVVDLSGQIGQAPGGTVDWAGSTYRVLRPSLSDLMVLLRRKAQIVTPKDALPLTYLAGVGPGARVAEAGSGSGALTTVLAYVVGETGRVYSYDRRPEFLEVARRNLVASGLQSRVEFRERDVAVGGFLETELDSVVLDLAEPWAVLGGAHSALRVGGYVAAYVPTYNQLEQTVRTMRTVGFEDVHALEVLERALHVGEGGTRPEFDMLGHTGFLSAGRKVN
jgi:tRNA (adenine57-N1/adenine58-N1)-methyltransferase